MRKFKEGDICKSDYETRIILTVGEDGYYYITNEPEYGGLFLNPTKAYAGFTFMEQKYKYIGEIPKEELEKIQKTVISANIKFAEAFEEVRKIGRIIKVQDYIRV